MERKINKLKYGSIIPVLKYRFGNNPLKKISAQIHPKVLFFNLEPILNNITGNITERTALGSLAEKLLIPNIFMEITCNQKYNGGFSWNGSKLTMTWKKLLETIISLEDSAKLISSQSNKLKHPIEGNTKTIA